MTSISDINDYLFFINGEYFLKIKDIKGFLTMGFFVKEDMYKYKPHTKDRFIIKIKRTDRVFLYSELHRFYTKKELRNKKINEMLST